jgi:hypothetical protein
MARKIARAAIMVSHNFENAVRSGDLVVTFDAWRKLALRIVVDVLVMSSFPLSAQA